MNCNCSDWQQNDIVLDMAFFNSLINDRNLRHCAVKPFAFCPWCAQRLIVGEQLRQRREKEAREDERLGYAMGLGYDSIDSEH